MAAPRRLAPPRPALASALLATAQRRKHRPSHRRQAGVALSQGISAVPVPQLFAAALRGAVLLRPVPQSRRDLHVRPDRGNSLHAFAVRRRRESGAADHESRLGFPIFAAEIRSKAGVPVSFAVGISAGLKVCRRFDVGIVRRCQVARPSDHLWDLVGDGVYNLAAIGACRFRLDIIEFRQ